MKSKTKSLYKITLRKPIKGFLEVTAEIYAGDQKEAVMLASRSHKIESLIITDSSKYKMIDAKNLTVEAYQELEEDIRKQKKRRSVLRMLASRKANQNKYTYLKLAKNS